MPLALDGKVYDIPNVGKVKLYPISKVAQALTDAGIPRDTQTVRKWEVRGVIPRALFRFGGKRLYSKEQIDTIVRVAVECNLRQGLSIAETDFINEVWEAMEKVNAKYIKKSKKKER
jgi:DNA-binding transcriptional MerR regulator